MKAHVAERYAGEVAAIAAVIVVAAFAGADTAADTAAPDFDTMGYNRVLRQRADWFPMRGPGNRRVPGLQSR